MSRRTRSSSVGSLRSFKKTEKRLRSRSEGCSLSSVLEGKRPVDRMLGEMDEKIFKELYSCLGFMGHVVMEYSRPGGFSSDISRVKLKVKNQKESNNQCHDDELKVLDNYKGKNIISVSMNTLLYPFYGDLMYVVYESDKIMFKKGQPTDSVLVMNRILDVWVYSYKWCKYNLVLENEKDNSDSFQFSKKGDDKRLVKAIRRKISSQKFKWIQGSVCFPSALNSKDGREIF